MAPGRLAAGVIGTSLALWALVWWCARWGNSIEHHTGIGLGIGAAPFVGHWRVASLRALLLPFVVGGVGVMAGPMLARARQWSLVVLGAAAGWVVWVLALAMVDGRTFITQYIRSQYDYLAGVRRVGSPGGFLAHFTQRINAYPTHVRGHPPGTVVVLWAIDRVGLSGSGPVLALCLLGGAAMVAGVLVAARSLGGEPWARRTAPFLMMAPAGLVATNVDLVYAGLAAWVVAGAALATDTQRGRRGRWVAAIGSGLALGLAMLGSYGLAPMVLPMIVVCLVRRRTVVVAGMGAVAAAVVAGTALWGFWWLDGLAATRHQYWTGLAAHRPGGYFAVADLVVAATMLGPLTLVAIGRLITNRRLAPRAIAATIAAVGGVVAVAVISQMSKAEVERIWQPFYPWFVMAVPLLFIRPVGPSADDHSPASATVPRSLLAVQMATGLVLAGLLRSPW